MQKSLGLVTILDESHLEAIKKFAVHILSAICVITDESNKLNKNLSLISLELILSFLICIGSTIETNSFTCFKLHIPNVESKIKINSILFDPLTPMCVHQGCLLGILQHCG